MTKDGPDPNKPCVFPFIDRGISHSKCTSGASDLQQWCPTEVDRNGHYIDEKWGNCDSNCETGNTSFVSLNQVVLDSWICKDIIKILLMSDKYTMQSKLNLLTLDFFIDLSIFNFVD